MKQFAKVASIYITVVSKVFLIRYKIPKLQEFLEKFGKPVGEGKGLGRGGSGALSGTREVYKAIFTSAIQTPGGVYIR